VATATWHHGDDPRTWRPDRAPAKKRGRPIDFGPAQQDRYKGRNVVEWRFNKLKQWRGIAMRSDKTARDYRAGLSLAVTLHWVTSGF
jgi:transposase